MIFKNVAISYTERWVADEVQENTGILLPNSRKTLLN